MLSTVLGAIHLVAALVVFVLLCAVIADELPNVSLARVDRWGWLRLRGAAAHGYPTLPRGRARSALFDLFAEADVPAVAAA